MTITAIKSITSALERIDIADHPLDLDIDALRAELNIALASLSQGPVVYDDLSLHARLNREVAKFGTAAAAARSWGVTRQTVHAALAGPKPCPPAILRAIGIRRVSGRRLYTEV